MAKQWVKNCCTPIFTIAFLLIFAMMQKLAGAAEAGDIVMIKRYTGEILGPYTLKDLHSHEDNAHNDTLTGNADALIGNANALTGIADALTENAEALIGNADALIGNAEEGSGNDIFMSDSEGEDEDEAGLQEFPLPYHRDTMTLPVLVHESNGMSLNSTGNSKPSIALLPTVITTVVSRSSTSQQVPSLKSTPPTTPGHSTIVSPITSYQSSSTTHSSSCHEECVSILHSTKVHVTPAESFIREGSSMRLVCEVKNREEGAEQVIDDIQLFWLFQKQDPSASECSIEVTPYLELCTGFTNRTAERWQNATHISTIHMLTGLKQHNTGLYMCQVRAHCCGSVPQHQLQHHVTVWQSDYTIELIVMATVAAVLAVLLGIDVYNNWMERKARRDSYKKMVSVLPSSFPTAGGGGKVLHLPLQQDNDDDTASFTSEDSTMP